MRAKTRLSAQWLDVVRNLLYSPTVQSMRQWYHHRTVTCLEHSLFVSYVAFRVAKRRGWDARAAARAGLLHDLYLYDPHSLSSREQCKAHPVAALANARRLCRDLTPEEENAIISHMWPLCEVKPSSTVAAAVILADKYCSILEAFCLFSPRKVRRLLPAVQV